MRRALVFALALAASSLQAQQHPLVGSWQVSFLAGMSIENGVETPIIGTGTLTIEAQGDSLIGTLVRDLIPEIGERPPARLAGVADGEVVTLISATTANLTVNGASQTAPVVSTWKLTAKGDALEGTVARTIEGFDEMARPTAVTGTRNKS